MPRYPLTQKERVLIAAWLKTGKAVGIHGYKVLERLIRLRLTDFRADMALLERVFERLHK